MNPDLWRVQMGKGIAPWGSGPGMRHEVNADSWSLITGLPAPDVNMVLLFGPDPDRVPEVMAGLQEEGVAALVMLTGSAAAHADRAPADWECVAQMPVMYRDLGAATLQGDQRVRVAGAEDADAVARLLAAAFGLDSAACKQWTEPLRQPYAGLQYWLLEQDGEAVSTVAGTFVDDTVSLWAMATPEHLRRRGYAKAVLSASLADARSCGAATGLLGATPDGQPLYENTGWRTFESWQVFTNASSLQFSN